MQLGGGKGNAPEVRANAESPRSKSLEETFFFFWESYKTLTMPKTGGYQRIVAMVGSSTKLEECTFGRCTRSAQKRSCSYFLRHCGHYWTHSIKCFSVSINFYNTIVSSLLFFLFFLLQYQTCRHPYVLPKYTCRDLLRISPPLVVWTLSFTMKCNLYYFLIRRILFIIISPSFFYVNRRETMLPQNNSGSRYDKMAALFDILTCFCDRWRHNTRVPYSLNYI